MTVENPQSLRNIPVQRRLNKTLVIVLLVDLPMATIHREMPIPLSLIERGAPSVQKPPAAAGGDQSAMEIRMVTLPNRMLIFGPRLNARRLLQLVKHSHEVVFPLLSPARYRRFERALFEKLAARDDVLKIRDRSFRSTKAFLTDLRDEAQPRKA